jgi:hypothetical protein
MSLSKSKCWYSNNCLHFLKCGVPFYCTTGYGLVFKMWCNLSFESVSKCVDSHHAECRYEKCSYDECHHAESLCLLASCCMSMCIVVMLSGIMRSVITFSAITITITVLYVIM